MHKEGSKDWWDEKYAAHASYLYGKAPSTFLTAHVEDLTKGDTLDVAMGEGRNSVFLASKGFSVTGVDFSPTAVERAKILGKESGVSFDAKLQDLEFYLIPLMKYDTIVVVDFHPPITLMKGLARGLKNGGTLLLEGYTMDQCRLSGGFKPEPFECFKPNEALADVRDLHLVYYNERRASPTESRVQLLARKHL